MRTIEEVISENKGDQARMEDCLIFNGWFRTMMGPMFLIRAEVRNGKTKLIVNGNEWKQDTNADKNAS